MQAANSNTGDEVNLNEALARMFRLLFSPVVVLIKNYIITALFILAGVAAGFITKYGLAKKYSASFVVRPFEKNDHIHLHALNDLRILLLRNDTEQLSKTLKIEKELAEALTELKVMNYIYAKNRADSTNLTEVKFEVLDPQHISAIQNALLNYVEENPYFVKLRKIQNLNIALKQEMIEKDLRLLDSLKKLQLASYDKLKITEQNSVYLKDLINPTSTYTLSLERLNQKASLLAQSQFLSSFELVKSASVSLKPSWPPRLLYVQLFTCAVSLILAYAFIQIRAWQRKA